MSYMPIFLRARTVAEIAADELKEHQLSLLRAKLAIVRAEMSLKQSSLEEVFHAACIEILKTYEVYRG